MMSDDPRIDSEGSALASWERLICAMRMICDHERSAAQVLLPCVSTALRAYAPCVCSCRSKSCSAILLRGLQFERERR